MFCCCWCLQLGLLSILSWAGDALLSMQRQFLIQLKGSQNSFWNSWESTFFKASIMKNYLMCCCWAHCASQDASPHTHCLTYFQRNLGKNWSWWTFNLNTLCSRCCWGLIYLESLIVMKLRIGSSWSYSDGNLGATSLKRSVNHNDLLPIRVELWRNFKNKLNYSLTWKRSWASSRKSLLFFEHVVNVKVFWSCLRIFKLAAA